MTQHARHRQNDERIQGDLTIPRIVFMVLAAASPLAVVVATLPLAFSVGAGSAQPAMYVIAGVVLLLFAVGYAAMSREVVGAGGLYVYVARGLGPFAAIVAGFLALLAYAALSVMLVGTLSYFTQQIAAELGLDLPWVLWATVAIGVVGILGYRRIDTSAKVLGTLVCTELLLIVIANAALVSNAGVNAFPLKSFDLAGIGPAALSIGLMFAFSSFLGFEAAALYGEEARNPTRAVPVATFVSVALIALIYGLTSWILTGVIGPDQVRDAATADPGDLLFHLIEEHLSPVASDLTAVLLLSSLFATLLACHNSANRLVFALARHRVLPAKLARVHQTHGSPAFASLTQSGISLFVIFLFAATGLNPYTTVAASMSGLGTLCLVALQALTAFSIFIYFRRKRTARLWSEQVAPLISSIFLWVAVVLIVLYFHDLTGDSTAAVQVLPLVALLVTIIAAIYASWMKHSQNVRYTQIGAFPEMEMPNK